MDVMPFCIALMAGFIAGTIHTALWYRKKHRQFEIENMHLWKHVESGDPIVKSFHAGKALEIRQKALSKQ